MPPSSSFWSAMIASMKARKFSPMSQTSEPAWPAPGRGRKMAKSLLERQASLVEFMTSGSAIFGKASDAPVAADLLGIDRALLSVEAQFSHAKRMQKIIAVLPRTFAQLGSRKERIIRAFVE